MAINFNQKSGSCSSPCLDKFGCPSDRAPDFVIKRHDTRPYLKVSIQDCGVPLDLEGLVVEANMWANAKLKKEIDEDDDYFSLADNVGFEQIMVGDIIVMDRVRLPEHMLVVGFDEANDLVKVQRGYHGTSPSPWKKGTKLRIFRMMNAPAFYEISYEDIQNVDGTVDKDVLSDSFLVYEWNAEDTCLPGCYWLEFKVLKMIDTAWFLPGGFWTGDIHTHTDNYFYTGSVHTDASVKLSYNQIEDKYHFQPIHWSGELHLHTDDKYYTGTIHDNGSVLLAKESILDNVEYKTTALLSVIPSFTDESLTASDFGCILGEGVEWVRRFPDRGAILIKIENTPTSEL